MNEGRNDGREERRNAVPPPSLPAGSSRPAGRPSRAALRRSARKLAARPDLGKLKSFRPELDAKPLRKTSIPKPLQAQGPTRSKGRAAKDEQQRTRSI